MKPLLHFTVIAAIASTADRESSCNNGALECVILLVMVTDRFDRAAPGVASAVNDGTTWGADYMSVTMSLKPHLHFTALSSSRADWI